MLWIGCVLNTLFEIGFGIFMNQSHHGPLRVLNVIGTRPEAIKMAPLITELHSRGESFHPITCITAQHRDLLDQVLDVFSIDSDYDLDLMQEGQSLINVMTGALSGLDRVITESKPDVVLAQGDTSTTFIGCLAGSMHRVKVGHLEAGLRSHDKSAPFPEEINRRMASVTADWHFAPTEQAKGNLLREQIADDDILVSGNTVIDALLTVSRQTVDESRAPFNLLDKNKRLIMVTAHRRESFGPAFEGICQALVQIAQANQDVELVYPVHPNPNVKEPAHRIMGGVKNIHLIEPLGYFEFVHLLKRAFFAVTDSGGVQEEAPSLGTPVLVMRDTTERPEGIEAGNAKLVGTGLDRIVSEVQVLLDDARAHKAMSTPANPYGDGHSAKRIVDFIQARFTSD
jgi:UDP-N-acetylglucosamine 2-epimerase (non-hydrolysing)